MGKIAEPLRLYAKGLELNHENIGKTLLIFADEIDRAHEQRMEQCRRETKRAFGHHIRAVVSDYERDIKWKQMTHAHRVVEVNEDTDGATGRCHCDECGSDVEPFHRYCPMCGAKFYREDR